MNNIGQQQAQIQNKLKSVPVESQNQGVKISGNALKEINNIEIAQEILDACDKEMLEDLLLATFNDFIHKATMIESNEAQQLMSSMIPSGLEDLFK